LEVVFDDAKCELAKNVRRVVIVGNKISPGQPDKKDDGQLLFVLFPRTAKRSNSKIRVSSKNDLFFSFLIEIKASF